ncbi:hypothetical protein C8035_v009188 [Colletotrichum spinosum]|uniref:Uncharacterized protein n=1 Tax=Colletotrichum spinosum TaxID=1347390 RepID=A0A4R8QHA1_9PEZI|nr:hypothetical protein C8035_v009188 [Colletotrichum spinosum]
MNLNKTAKTSHILEILPAEIVHGEQLTADEHLASLVAFATTGIACFKMASCTLLKTVEIYLWDNPRQTDQYGIVDPNEQVGKVFERIFRLQLQHHVRRLVICAASRIRLLETADLYSYRRSLRYIWGPSRAYDCADVARGETDLAVDTWDRDGVFGHNLPEPTKIWHQRRDVDWGRIASLFEHLPVLNEIVFSSEHSFPSSLLGVLHQNHPDCHLYVIKFCRYFSSRLEDAPGVLESPSLRGLRFINVQARAYLPDSVAAECRPGRRRSLGAEPA